MKTLDRLAYLPRPRRVRRDMGRIRVRGRMRVQLLGAAAGMEAVEQAWRRLPGVRTVRVERDADLLIRVDPALRGGVESYRLAIGNGGIRLDASEASGAFRGLATLAQILRQAPEDIPCGEIDDAPDFPIRGVMLDISRDKVPSMATLFALIDDFAAWKINHVQLYMEHTFAYREHRTVWEHASPLTAREVQELDAHCRDRFIELAPNQNSLGHMERWLRHPVYRRLAECPGGYRAPSGAWKAPSTLNPTDPRVIGFLGKLYGELLPNFSSSHFHIGGDEAWELGKGRSHGRCRRLGMDRVYLDFIARLGREAGRYGRMPLYWGDMVWNHFPRRMRELPRNMTMVDWGYYRAYPFAAHGEALARAGVPFWFAPGTSTWSTLLGCNEAGFGSNASATAAGVACGAGGILNTDWGDNGHWQYLPVSYIPFAAGAAMAWCGKTNTEPAIRAALDSTVFLDPECRAARAMLGLADTWRLVGRGITSAFTLDRLLRGGLAGAVPENVSPRALRATDSHLEECLVLLGKSRMGRADGGLILHELTNGIRMARHACRLARHLLTDSTVSSRLRRELAGDMDGIVDEHARLWRARNRPGGLEDSLGALRRCRDAYAD